MNNELKIDRDRINVERSASVIMHILNDYIPDACRNDVYHSLCDAFADAGLELTSKETRKEYEGWKDLLGLSGPSSKQE
jgi:hypothetical protein